MSNWLENGEGARISVEIVQKRVETRIFRDGDAKPIEILKSYRNPLEKFTFIEICVEVLIFRILSRKKI